MGHAVLLPLRCAAAVQLTARSRGSANLPQGISFRPCTRSAHAMMLSSERSSGKKAWLSFGFFTVLVLVLALDALIKQPYGLLRYQPDHEVKPCGFDYEASWSLGYAGGGSPASLMFLNNNGGIVKSLEEHKGGVLGESVLTEALGCKDIVAQKTSFLADPHLVAATRTENGSLVAAVDEHRHWKIESADELYLFYEQKNLEIFKGELSVALSTDQGATWEPLPRPVLRTPFHLSFPFIMWHDKSQRWLMLPETHKLAAITIWDTSPEEFPFGWRLLYTPVFGSRYVDTSVTVYEGKTYIFSSEHDNARLYYADDVLDVWTEHPASPLTRKNRRWARAAGRVVLNPDMENGVLLYRFAQDCRKFYGERVYIFGVTKLSTTEYEQAELGNLSPTKRKDDWNAERLHHIDAHWLSKGVWVAMIDGDQHPNQYHYWNREGLWHKLKQFFLFVSAVILFFICYSNQTISRQLLVFVQTARHALSMRFACFVVVLFLFILAEWKTFTLYRLMTNEQKHKVYMVCFIYSISYVVSAKAYLLVNMLFEWVISLLRHPSPKFSPNAPRRLTSEGQTLSITSRLPLRKRLASLVPLICIVLVSYFVRGSNLCIKTMDGDTPPDLEAIYGIHGSDRGTPIFKPSSNSLLGQENDFVIGTCASKAFFLRLKNFVGSVHVWEPDTKIYIYDLGLTTRQANEANKWKNVELKSFPFEKYGLHVQNLFNYAFKPLIFHELLQMHETVLVFDAGVELRRDISNIKMELFRNGWFSARQPGSTKKKTHTGMISKMEEITGRKDLESAIEDAHFCAGGIQGYVRGTAAYKELFEPQVVCAQDEDCIDPEGAGRQNHNYDQSAFTLLVHATGRSCAPRHIYAEGRYWMTSSHPLVSNDVVLFLRKSQVALTQYPYHRYVQRKAVVRIDETVRSKSASTSQIEGYTSFRMNSHDPLRQCLRNNQNDREKCKGVVSQSFSIKVQVKRSLSHHGNRLLGLYNRDSLICNEEASVIGIVLVLAVISAVNGLIIVVIIEQIEDRVRSIFWVILFIFVTSLHITSWYYIPWLIFAMGAFAIPTTIVLEAIRRICGIGSKSNRRYI